MEDGIGNFLYIILLAIISIVGLIKNNAKKKSEQQHNDYEDTETVSTAEDVERSPRSNPFEDFIRQQLEGVDPVTEDPGNENIENTTPIHEFAEAHSKPLQEGEAVFAKTENELLSDDMHEPDFSITEELEQLEEYDYNQIEKSEINDERIDVDEFDAKKAVIYAEILKRPE